MPYATSFPAAFQLVAAMNPCPCGLLGDPSDACRCTPPILDRYRARVSGPLLERIDLHVEVPALRLAELRAGAAESSETVADRVARARAVQRQRFPAGHPTPLNVALRGERLERCCRRDAAGRALLESAFERLGLSARGLTRLLKVARTVADLAASAEIAPAHVAEAIQYRGLDRRPTA